MLMENPISVRVRVDLRNSFYLPIIAFLYGMESCSLSGKKVLATCIKLTKL